MMSSTSLFTFHNVIGVWAFFLSIWLFIQTRKVLELEEKLRKNKDTDPPTP